MSELSFLVPGDAALVGAAVGAVQRGLGEKLRSVLLVGAAVPPPRHQGAHRLELLVVASALHVAALSNLARELGPEVRAAIRLHLLTERELLRSADVFTLELAEYRSRHVLLLGPEPFGDLHYTRAELRRSLEHALRALARRLRDAVLSGALGQDSAARAASSLVRDGVELLVMAAPHALELLGEPAPAEEAALLTALADQARADARALCGLLALTRQGSGPSAGLGALGELLEAVEAAIVLVDTVGADS